ncbi:cobalamin-dependent protein [Amycolatopsis sp. NPDC049688]|uniref:cobalamin B12-binding domain-containing protein n=1 Tax=Amycolatopsis sp. NPDC049688 TaxID=3154733 RepID=UPI00344268D0
MNSYPATRANRGLDVVVSGTASDSHTWNLLYLQLFLTERGHRVVNVGACVPDRLLVAECRRHGPQLIVLSSVNGHGFTDGARVIGPLRRVPELAGTAIVIGGKLGTGDQDGERAIGELLALGFDAVFHRPDSMAPFEAFLGSLPEPVTVPC